MAFTALRSTCAPTALTHAVTFAVSTTDPEATSDSGAANDLPADVNVTGTVVAIAWATGMSTANASASTSAVMKRFRALIATSACRTPNHTFADYTSGLLAKASPMTRTMLCVAHPLNTGALWISPG